MAQENFNWLHLTDLHYGQKGLGPLWPNVRNAFFQDLESLHEKTGPWHAVFFTGDLVFSGKKEDFAKFDTDVLPRIWQTLERLGSGNAVLLAVPGNHDLVRPQERSAVVRELLRPNLVQEIGDQFWDHVEGEYRPVFDAAFANYQDWWRNTPYRGHIQKDGLLPGDFATTLDVGGHSIAVVGVNTTFLQLDEGHYEERLAWNVRQMQAVCDGDWVDWIEDHHARILLTHQGPDWLEPSSREDYPEINPAGRFAVHIFGHMHETVFQTKSSGGGKPLRHWQGSSLFGLEKYGSAPKKLRRHGYSVGRITFGETAEIRFWPRLAVQDPINGWRFERDIQSFSLLEEDGGTLPQPIEGLSTSVSSSRAKATQAGRRSGPGRAHYLTIAKRPVGAVDEEEEAEQDIGHVAGPYAWEQPTLFDQVIDKKIQATFDLLSERVLQAVLEQIVPGPLFDEIKNILTTEVIRYECEYVITFKEPYNEMAPGCFVIRRDLSFFVENRLNRDIVFYARSSYSGTEDPDSIAWRGRQYHLELRVDDRDIEIKEGKNLFRRGGFIVLEEPVPMAAKDSARIFLRSEEPCLIEAGRNSYIQGTPVIGIKVDVRNEFPELVEALDVQMHHPAAHKVKRDFFGRYVLPNAFFPGQGFQVLWRKRSKSDGK